MCALIYAVIYWDKRLRIHQLEYAQIHQIQYLISGRRSITKAIVNVPTDIRYLLLIAAMIFRIHLTFTTHG